MTEWLKSFTDVFKAPQNSKALSLKERLEQEQGRLKEEEERLRKAGPRGEHRMPGETDAQANKQDCTALATLLRWKLDVKVENLDQNPARVDGYWFGVRRYFGPPLEPDGPNEVLWKLHIYRPCMHCKHLIPTMELGDSAETKVATQQMMRGETVTIAKSTEKLAAYLNEVEKGRLDTHMPRFCPSCRKPIKGTL
jgi:hypothetical protein